jgi:hypothetical protein
MHNADIISMPDRWEYPWYAAWDLAFHGLALTLVDEDFGRQQLDLMLREDYLHPNGQLPGTNGTRQVGDHDRDRAHSKCLMPERGGHQKVADASVIMITIAPTGPWPRRQRCRQ